MHKIANVLNKLPKSQQPKAKRSLQGNLDGRDEEGGREGLRRLHRGLHVEVRRPLRAWRRTGSGAGILRLHRALETLAHLEPDREHVRLVRHRTIRTKGCLSNETALAMVFKLVDAARRSWRRLDGHNQLPKVVLGAKFKDGLEVASATDHQPKAAA